MFDLAESHHEEISAVIVGIGSVGCKIVKRIPNTSSDYFNSQIDKIYLHTSRDILSSYSDNPSQHLVLSSHVHYIESDIKTAINGADIVFLVAGFGGETGSQVPQHVARIAKDLGILCIGLFSFPFEFEGRAKKFNAQQAYLSVSKYIDSLVCIENDRFLDISLQNQSLNGADALFHESNNHFNAVINGLLSLVTKPGLINIDFSDLRCVLAEMGLSTVGYSKQIGEDRAEQAVKALLASPSMQNHDLTRSKGIIVNITAGLDISIEEFETVGNYLKANVGENSTVVIGAVIDQTFTDSFEVTAIITGLPELPIDKSIKSPSFDFVKLYKSITFDPHQASAGLSILSYFNEFLHQKYSGIEAKVSIEQSDNKVSLIVETSEGDIEKVEKSLHDFGLVVVGSKTPNEVLESRLDIEKLQMKLEMAAMELKHSENFIRLYQNENEGYKSRIKSLEVQMHELQATICQSLTRSQSIFSHHLSHHSDLPLSLIKILEKNLVEDISSIAKEQIIEEIKNSVTNKSSSISLRQLADNAIYGVAGNSLYSLVISILNTLPK